MENTRKVTSIEVIPSKTQNDVSALPNLSCLPSDSSNAAAIMKISNGLPLSLIFRVPTVTIVRKLYTFS